MEDAHLSLHLYDLSGRLLNTYSAEQDYFTIMANDLSKGLYVFQVMAGSEMVYSGKLVVE